MTLPPKRLFIPNKNAPDAHHQYGQDMRAIEIFNPINKLVAGSGITLTPADGSGPQVEIASSGGGGGTSPGIGFLGAGSDTNDYPFTTIHLGMNDDNSAIGQQGSEYCLFDNTTLSAQKYSFAKSWFTYVAPGDTVNFLPIVRAPNFTGSNLIITLVMSCQSIDATEMDVENTFATSITLASGATTRPPAADYANVTSTGTDISFIQGTGTSSGSGQISTGGGSPGTLAGLYLASVQLEIAVPAGNTFP